MAFVLSGVFSGIIYFRERFYPKQVDHHNLRQMILTSIIFFYITLVSWSYGDTLYSLLKKINKKVPTFFSSTIIQCFVGLSLIGVLFTVASLFIPLKGIGPQVMLLAPVVISIILKKRWRLFSSYARNVYTQFSFSALLMLASCVVLVLIMHGYTITHPDTLNYHAQNMKWVEQYRVVPGVANLYPMYGLQSSWFILCALFSFKFTGTSALTFLNATVLIWFVLFTINKINHYFFVNKKDERVAGLLWMLLLASSFWSYTQIRLCATSGSPDFVTALYLWLIIYLVLKEGRSENWVTHILLIFVSVFAITIKLQALPILFLSFYCYLKYGEGRTVKKLIVFSSIGIVVAVPFLIRNVISSGYLLFPSAFPDIFSFDWKARKDFLIISQLYITAYARTNADFNIDLNYYAYHLKLVDWLPIWWKLQSLADRIILLSTPVSAGLLLILRKQIKLPENRMYAFVLPFLMLGIAFWFIMAPDPRFGFGFLIPFTGCSLIFFLKNLRSKIVIPKYFGSILTIAFSVTMLGYASYRVHHFFNKENILQPAGIINPSYKPVEKNGTRINMPEGDKLCGDIDLPCSRLNSDSVKQRGDHITDGFKRMDVK